MENVKMFLFARWIATCFADTHLDKKMRCESDKGFNESESISVLNRENGEWYKNQLIYFNTFVYPNYVENGTVENTKNFLNQSKEIEMCGSHGIEMVYGKCPVCTAIDREYKSIKW